jgi:tetratricopeptide (TPR) repeat protein
MISATTETPSTTAPTVSAVRALVRQSRYAEALAATEMLLEEKPDDRDALLLRAICLRCLGRLAPAHDTLALLAQHHPRFSRAHEERGQWFAAQRQAAPAIDAFRTAVTLNHALPSSWHMLEGLYRLTGQPQNAAEAAEQLATLRKIPSEVVTATSLFLDGDLDEAESLIRAFLLRVGNEIEAMRLLARIGLARKVFDDAELLLAAVLELAPDYSLARAEYAEVLIEQLKYVEARHTLERLLKEDPRNSLYYRSLYATTMVGLGEHAQAVNLYRQLIGQTPNDPDLHLSLAHALKTLGRRDEAVATYRQAASLRADFGDAYWSLANLKTYRFTEQELERLRAMQDQPNLALIDRYHFHFALGKALEDRGEYAESFAWYERGNARKRAESRYRPEIIENNTRQQIEVCTAEFLDVRRDWGNPAPDPIFIVGLPRSGSTLVEQILASHSAVEGTQELAYVQQIVAGLRGREPDLDNPRYPGVLRELRAEDFRQRAQQYLSGAQEYRSGKPYFIDKMPNNFRHLGLIRVMLPNAKIIDARREPLACCFSNLKQLFARGQEFTYSIDDIARYYRTYLELMRHWNTVLPGHVLKVQHEDLVDDLEGNVRRILAFCGLDFEPQCIEFHKTARSVRTASSEQVRQPIYREGLDQWKHFEPWLEPLKIALGDALTRYRE